MGSSQEPPTLPIRGAGPGTSVLQSSVRLPPPPADDLSKHLPALTSHDGAVSPPGWSLLDDTPSSPPEAAAFGEVLPVIN